MSKPARFHQGPAKVREDLLGFGAGWAAPANPLLRDQYILEGFYRYQLTSNLAFTPDVQLIIHHALDPTNVDVWVFGLRTRLAF